MGKASGERSKSTAPALLRTIQQLPRLSVADLKYRYEHLFDEQARIGHKEYLLRRIAWQLQASVEGDLSERARRRIEEIADVSELHVFGGIRTAPPPPSAQLPAMKASIMARDPRLPPAGSSLRRRYRGREIVVTVLDQGFEYDSEHYRSLSAIARRVTGTRWNGLLFFGLAERRYA